MSIKNIILLLVYSIIVLTVIILTIDEFNKTENQTNKTIIEIIILIIYMLIVVHILRKWTKYRKINKTLLIDSIMAGMAFGIAAYIFVINVNYLSDIWYLPVITSFLTGSFFWHLIFWDRRMTIHNGIYAGALSILFSNILFWYFSILYTEINRLLSSGKTLELSDIITKIIESIIMLPIWTIMMTFLGFIFGFNIVIPTIIIGGFTGGLIAYVYQKRTAKTREYTK